MEMPDRMDVVVQGWQARMGELERSSSLEFRSLETPRDILWWIGHTFTRVPVGVTGRLLSLLPSSYLSGDSSCFMFWGLVFAVALLIFRFTPFLADTWACRAPLRHSRFRGSPKLFCRCCLQAGRWLRWRYAGYFCRRCVSLRDPARSTSHSDARASHKVSQIQLGQS